MTRHFYDLEKLMNTPYADLAINDAALYHEIVEHRRKFYHVGYVDYDKDLPDLYSKRVKRKQSPIK